ncbi:MAG: peptidoglycan glycosyltransferase [Lachnospiraceae bacterium]|nr:peptidoglycan glycosyltransferase [Lachnospiraceae bacterium]
MFNVKLKRNEKRKLTRSVRKKLILSFGIVVLALFGLIFRLMYIEYTSGEKYEKKVLSQQEYDSKTIAYQRGNITDTKGSVLATSVDVYNVILDCKVLSQEKENIEPTLKALATAFEDLDYDELYQKLKDNPSKQYMVLEKKKSYDEVQKFIQMQDDSENYPNISSSGVWMEKEYERQYPYSSLASSIVGFVSSGNVGTTGLENYYNTTLNGTNGREYGYLNSDNNYEKTIKEAEDGMSIVTTIDINIQSAVEQKIQDFIANYTNGYREGRGATNISVLVMDPNNGEILALADDKEYDLNNPRDLSGYYTEEELAGLSDEDQYNALNEIWQSYGVSSTYEPGSVAKPFTVAIGLETGTLTGNEVYYCDGYEIVGGSRISCVSIYGHGEETVEGALMDSCNDALMQMSYSIGIENFTKYQNVFGFGLKTNVDLPGEARTDSLIYTADNMTAVDLATNSFGQNFNTTMIQLGSSFCSLINGGYYYQPHVVRKILDSDGNTISTVSPTLLKQTVSEETSDTVRGYLVSVVSDGTGATAKVNGYSMGGKTGTAEKVGRDGENYLVSFIGFAPAENPQVVIYAIIDEPNVEDQAHSSYAQQLVKDILTEILPYMNIYMDEELVPEESEEEAVVEVQAEETVEGTTGDTAEVTAEPEAENQ